jgi:hypothetical protein
MHMVEAKGGDVSRYTFQVAYDGAKAADHTMDVEALAPALLAFGRLIRTSNEVLNQNRATVKVLVASDFEHKCFNINFEVVQTVIQKIRSLLDDDRIQTAKDLLDTIGVAGTAATAVAGLFGFLKWKRGRPIKKVQQIRDSSAAGVVQVQIHIEGDGNTIQIPADVLKLAENRTVLSAVKQTLEPVESGEAERIEFRKADKKVAALTKSDTKAIVDSCNAGPDPVLVTDEDSEPETVTGTLYSYGPVFDSKAKTWRFKYKGKPIYADISGTNIAKDAVRRGGSFMNDRYRVRMDVTPPTSEDGAPHYKIKHVLDFTAAEQQGDLPLRKARGKAATIKKQKRRK